MFFYVCFILLFAVGVDVIVKEYNVIYYLGHYHIKLKDIIENMDKIVWPSIFDDTCENLDFAIDEKPENNTEKKPEKKYEDKYLDVVRNMNFEIEFNDSELEMLNMHKREFYRAITDGYINNISDLKSKIDDLTLEISVLSDYEVTGNTSNMKSELLSNDKACAGKIKTFENEIQAFTDQIKIIETKLSDKVQIETDALEEAKKIIINEIYDKLVNSFIIEKTPLGNVLMFYNNKRGSFEYYSDSNIPYRYLEVVGRKYVKMFNCRSIYFDMEEELHKYEIKMEELERLENEKKKKREMQIEQGTTESKKNVFVKLKSYNKDSVSGRVNSGAPPKNSILNTSISNTTNEKMLLKENANRYTHEGKLSNFSFLKKIPRKTVDKKYAMSFADFKKMQCVQK